MKRRIFLVVALVIAAVSMFSLNGCMEMTNGTGVLNVHVYDARYDTEIKVFPYGADYRDNSLLWSTMFFVGLLVALTVGYWFFLRRRLGSRK